jgi:hypothetical protein
VSSAALANPSEVDRVLNPASPTKAEIDQVLGGETSQSQPPASPNNSEVNQIFSGETSQPQPQPQPQMQLRTRDRVIDLTGILGVSDDGFHYRVTGDMRPYEDFINSIVPKVMFDSENTKNNYIKHLMDNLEGKFLRYSDANKLSTEGKIAVLLGVLEKAKVFELAPGGLQEHILVSALHQLGRYEAQAKGLDINPITDTTYQDEVNYQADWMGRVLGSAMR